MNEELQALKAQEEAEEKYNPNTRHITAEDRQNIELAKRAARDIPNKEEVIKYCVAHGYYSEATGRQLLEGTWSRV